MNPLPNDEARPPVPLGQLLIDAGLITPVDLERVLEEQERTGRRLGELLVEGGYVAGRSVALALARQQGGLVATEYGYATPGTLGDQAEPQVPPVVEHAPSAGKLLPPPAEPPLELPSLRLAEVANVEPPAPEPEPEAPAFEPEPAAPEPVAEVVEEVSLHVQEPQGEAPPEPTVPIAPPPAPEPVAVEVVPIYAEPEPKPEPEPEPVAEAEPEPKEEPVEVVRQEEPAAPSRSYLPDRHVLFIPDPSGYRIIERSGPCPEAGAMATLDFGRFLVNRVGPSPFPGERVACAFLESGTS